MKPPAKLKCPHCDGTGSSRSYPIQGCANCDGDGNLDTTKLSFQGPFLDKVLKLRAAEAILDRAEKKVRDLVEDIRKVCPHPPEFIRSYTWTTTDWGQMKYHPGQKCMVCYRDNPHGTGFSKA